MAVTTKPAGRTAPPPLRTAPPAGTNAVAVIKPPRLAFPTEFEKKYEVDIDKWRTLVEAIFPGATTIESVGMALAYCKERKLDIFKRPVHIVSVYSTALRKQVETVWPGINELRSTAMRTQNYAGMDVPALGPMVEHQFDGGKISSWENGSQSYKADPGITMTFPEWCQITVYRSLAGNRVPFPGPRVYWLETYATKGRMTDNPNAMWEKRANGQLEKCAEAAALRRAFPEEIGDDYVPEEIGAFHNHSPVDITGEGSAEVPAAEPKMEDFQKPADKPTPAQMQEETRRKAEFIEKGVKPEDMGVPEPKVIDVVDQNATAPAQQEQPPPLDDIGEMDDDIPADDAQPPPEWALPDRPLVFDRFNKVAAFDDWADPFLDRTNALGAQQFLDFYDGTLVAMDRGKPGTQESAKWLRDKAKAIIEKG